VSGILRNYDKAVREGFEALRRGDEDKAIISFRKILRWVTEDFDKVSKLSPEEKAKLSIMLTDVGEEMIKLKEFDAAIKILEKAKTIDPKNFRAWMDIGKDLLQRNTQVPYALVCLREAAKLDPENVEAHLLLGDAYRVQGQLDKALGAYQKALKVAPENEDALQKVLRIQPENTDILERYIKVLEIKGNKEELLRAYNNMVSITGDIEYLERGLQIDPEDKGLLLSKAKLLLKEEKIDEAKDIVAHLRERYPDDPDIEMLYDELSPSKDLSLEEHEQVPAVDVGDLFGDIALEEQQPADVRFEEEENTVMGEEGVAKEQDTSLISPDEGSLVVKSKESEITPVVSEKEEMVPVQQREFGNVEQSGEEAEREPQEGLAAKVASANESAEGSEPVSDVRVSTPEPEVKEEPSEVASTEKLMAAVAESAEIQEPKEMPEPKPPKEKPVYVPPEDMFMQLYGLKKMNEAKQHLRNMNDTDVLKLLGENIDVLKFVYHALYEMGRYVVASAFIKKICEIDNSEENLVERARILILMDKLEDGEKLLNNIVKKNMKNGDALYLKAKIMSLRGNDIGARNFLMMALKFKPELKSKAKEDPDFEKYREKDWFNKITS